MAMSKAHIRASRKYNTKNYRQVTAYVNHEDYDIIDSYSKLTGISKAQLIIRSIKYCIANNIDVDGLDVQLLDINCKKILYIKSQYINRNNMN